MKIYNTMTRKKEDFVPIDESEIRCTCADRPSIIIFTSEMRGRLSYSIRSDGILNIKGKK